MRWRAGMQRGLLPLLLAAATLADLFVPWRWLGRSLASVVDIAVLGILLGRSVQTAHQIRRVARVGALLRTRIAELALTAGAVAFLVTKILLWAQGSPPGAEGVALDRAYQQYAVAFLVMAGLRLAVAQLQFRHLLHRLELQPSQTVAAGFALAILGGGLLLSLPFSVTSIEKLDILDALFTATSAVTVTGLSVYEPASSLTWFGKGLLLLLIQVGGIGTLAATASLVMLAGRRLQLKQATALQEAMDVDTVGHVRAMVLTVVGVTFAVEAAGAVLLHLAWGHLPEAAHPFVAVFHSVSAFCNAGFSILPGNNLMRFVDRPGVNGVIMALIVLGGLGFPVLRALGRAVLRWRRRRAEALSLHARLVVGTTALLIVVGTLGILVLDGSHTLASHSLGVRILAAAFQSVSARTAGYNTLDIPGMAPATLMLIMLLMFVGGSPGGTAGGIKTTTAATMFLTLRSVLRGRERVEALRRTIPFEQVQKALAVAGISAGFLAVGTLLLVAVTPDEPLRVAFEAVSAFATTGLSAGTTSKLGPGGKLIVMLLMFVGRTGPMTLAFALATRQPRVKVEFPDEKIMIG